MCGIAAILGAPYPVETTRRIIEAMTATIVHRGPDEWGIYVSPEIAFGHTRLAIIDVREGHQPMSDGRYVIAYNGEVYNHIELRRELEALGRRFRTRSDTEVVLQAFAQWGEEAIPRFNGQFAALIWDRREKTLTGFRDRYGVRPLFLMRHGGTYYFASETKAFDVIEGYQRSFSPNRLLEHGLLWNTLGSETVFEGIETIPPAYSMMIRPGGPPSFRRYYSLGETAARPPGSFAQAQEQFTGLLTDAVRLRLRSDVPVGAYLSGGIDSSIITSLTASLNRELFKTFSIGFTDGDFDESRYQKEMAAYIGSEHATLTVGYNEIEAGLAETVYHCERPLFRTAPLPLYLLSRMVRQNNIKVVLTGEAADEILFGYDSFKELKLLQFWNRFPGSTLRPQLIRRLYPHLHHYADPTQFGLMRMYYEGFLDRIDNDLASLNIRIANNSILENYFNRDLGVAFNPEALLEKVRATLPPQHRGWTLLQKSQSLEMQTLLAGYLLSSQGDRMSLAHGVEGRYPFLDHRLVETVFGYPDDYKLRVLSQKHILRQACRGRVPGSIIDRPKLPYQAPDLRAFLHNGRYSPAVTEYLSPERIEEYGIFDPKMTTRFLKKHLATGGVRVGYRDNMIMVFLLTTQMACRWMRAPRIGVPDEAKKCVDINEMSNQVAIKN